MNASASESTQAAQAALERFSDTIDAVAANPDPANAPPPLGLFAQLANVRQRHDHQGVSWERGFGPGDGIRMARAARCIAGANAIATILHADHEAEPFSEPEELLGDHLTSQLLFGLVELLHDAHHEFCWVSDQLMHTTPEGDRA